MNCCFPCLQLQRGKKTTRDLVDIAVSFNESRHPGNKRQKSTKEETVQVGSKNINAQAFTFRELATATKNFRQECLLGEGGFGRVYKGTIKSTGQVVAVKQLDRNGLHGNKEFLEEVFRLSLLDHPNLIKFIGYCADGDQRLLVHEFMPGGSLEDHLIDLAEGIKPLDWTTRIKIALGAAQGLDYLHTKADPPVIYHDLKATNIMLDQNFVPKLSDFGLAKLGPVGNSNGLPLRVMGTYGYCAPEYAKTGKFTIQSDVYSFGVILLELITGRRAIDNTRPVEEQNLISWAEPFFKDPKRFPNMADPHLNKQFPERSLNQAVAVAVMCLQEEPSARPLMSDVVTTLSFLSQDTEDPGKSGGSVSSRSNAASNSLPDGSESSDISVFSSIESSPESGFGISGRNNSNELQISSTLKQNGSSSGSKKINQSFSLKSKSSRESFDSFKDTATSTSSGNSEDSSSEATLLDP